MVVAWLRAQATSTRSRWIAAGAVIVVLIAVGTFLTRTPSAPPEVVVRPPEATVSATPQASAPAAPTETGTPFPTGQPSQLITNVKDLVSKFGYPPNTNYATIRIPRIGVDAKVAAKTVGRDGVMAAPAGPADVVWYDLGLWDGLGGAPGGGQNAVFSGHVDYADPVPYANVTYRGQAVFSQLHLLAQGDIVEVNYRGQTFRYKVEWRRQVGSEGSDWSSIWSSKTGADSLTLYTCGGEFNFQTRQYADRVIVRATRL